MHTHTHTHTHSGCCYFVKFVLPYFIYRSGTMYYHSFLNLRPCTRDQSPSPPAWTLCPSISRSGSARLGLFLFVGNCPYSPSFLADSVSECSIVGSQPFSHPSEDVFPLSSGFHFCCLLVTHGTGCGFLVGRLLFSLTAFDFSASSSLSLSPFSFFPTHPQSLRLPVFLENYQHLTLNVAHPLYILFQKEIKFTCIVDPTILSSISF